MALMIGSKPDYAKTPSRQSKRCVAFITKPVAESHLYRAVRQAIDVVGHSALLLVDSISGLASVDYEHDKWGADVTVSGSQKGLMMPPGLGFNALSDRALEAAKNGGSQRSYWDWQEMLASNTSGYFPYTPATTLLYGLREAIAMLEKKGSITSLLGTNVLVTPVERPL